MFLLAGLLFRSSPAAEPSRTVQGIAFFDEGSEPPPYSSLKIVYEHRWVVQGAAPPDWSVLYESLAEQARAAGADRVVRLLAGEEDPLIEEGHARWLLGIACRATGAATDTLTACDNCLVDWLPPDAAAAGTGSPESAAALERTSFAITRLRLGERGYYLQPTSSESAGPAATAAPAPVPANLALQMQVRRGWKGSGPASQENIAFSAALIWKASGGEAWRRSLGMTCVSPELNYVTGGDGRTTRATITELFGNFRSRGPTPDSDGDGVPDSRDQEFDSPKGAQVDWVGKARDDDGDGVPNGIDRDPYTPQGVMVDEWGVAADEDEDGVPDYLDECSDTPVEYEVDGRGCPIEEWTATLQQVLLDERVLRERLHFETGESTLLPDARARLDSIGVALSGLPGLRFVVDGHCDDVGTDEANQVLSVARAQACVNYLTERFPGLSRGQFVAHGYGKSRPVALGTDPESRFLNRRVEFSVSNPEEARRIVQSKQFRRRGAAQ